MRNLGDGGETVCENEEGILGASELTYHVKERLIRKEDMSVSSVSVFLRDYEEKSVNKILL